MPAEDEGRRLRRVALELAGLAPADREWLVGQLNDEERRRLTAAVGSSSTPPPPAKSAAAEFAAMTTTEAPADVRAPDDRLTAKLQASTDRWLLDRLHGASLSERAAAPPTAGAPRMTDAACRTLRECAAEVSAGLPARNHEQSVGRLDRVRRRVGIR